LETITGKREIGLQGHRERVGPGGRTKIRRVFGKNVPGQMRLERDFIFLASGVAQKNYYWSRLKIFI